MGNKVDVGELTTPQNSSFSTELNQKLDKLADEFDKVVYRDGSQDLTEDLNANSQRILNLPAPMGLTEPLRLKELQDLILGQLPESPELLQGPPGPAGPAGPAGPPGNPVFIAAGTGSVNRATQDKLRDFVSAKDFGAVGDLSVVDTAAIQAAINAVSASGGGTVHLPKGAYRTGTLTVPQDVHLKGEGKYNTRLVAVEGLNAPVIDRGGTLANIVNRGGVSDMAIVGSGKSNVNCYGIRSTYTNRAMYHDIDFFGCRIGMFFQNVWQDQWVNLHVHGGGTDASYIGFYGGIKDPTVGISNAVNAFNCIAQGVEKYGFRLENCSGSKFTSCEAMNGEMGWYIGAPSSGGEITQFGHFVNCLGDSNSQYNWRVEGGDSTVRRMLFSGCWGGTAGIDNLYVSGSSELLFTGCMWVAADNNAVRFFNSSRSTLVGCNLNDFNKSGGTGDGVLLENAQAITVNANQINTLTQVDGFAVQEIGSSNRNLITSNFLATPTDLIGAQTIEADNITF